jgi:hypothetical protein
VTVPRGFDAITLGRLRQIPLETAWAVLAFEVRTDPSYKPKKDSDSRRWHLTSSRGDFELLTTGLKWYDTRARRGGGGAIDLTMHLLGLSFVEAVNFLIDAAGSHGSYRP